MRVSIGSDHAGFALKKEIIEFLRELKYDVQDAGTHNADPVDYPDYAEAVGLVIQSGKADRGILICGSGVGVSVTANKIPGVRAAVCHDTYSAHQGVEHDSMNVLVLGSRVIGSALDKELAAAFLKAKFSNEPRHKRRLDKVIAIEDRYIKDSKSGKNK